MSALDIPPGLRTPSRCRHADLDGADSADVLADFYTRAGLTDAASKARQRARRLRERAVTWT